MTSNKKIAALIVAAGSGERFGGDTPKQFLPLLGKSVVQWSIEAFQKNPLVSEIVVAVNADRIPAQQEGVRYVSGGENRQQSVQKGLAALRNANPDVVLIHDAARPLISQELITSLCEAVAESGAAIPALAVTDTVKRAKDNAIKTESREGLYTVQTPQAFDFKLIDRLHQKYQDKSLTDDAALCEAEDYPVTFVPAQQDNIKITHPGDFPRAEQYLLIRNNDIRTGQGYDVHRLTPAKPGQKLLICGVVVMHDRVLEGHSDADVGLHAITDAILATICAGDIGEHFKPGDPRWKGADSSIFLKHAADLVSQQGGILTYVDVTLVCDAPKIAPYRREMQERVAEILNLPPSSISIKATTTEGLGFTGRREGIAAYAIATARLPFRTTFAAQKAGAAKA